MGMRVKYELYTGEKNDYWSNISHALKNVYCLKRGYQSSTEHQTPYRKRINLKVPLLTTKETRGTKSM